MYGTLAARSAPTTDLSFLKQRARSRTRRRRRRKGRGKKIPVDNVAAPVRRGEVAVPGLPYLVVYRVRENPVEILRVFHTARNWTESIN